MIAPLSAARLAFALAQPLAPLFWRATGRGVSETRRAREVEGEATPDGWAFAIWGPLFASGLWSAWKSRARAPVAAEWLESAAHALNALWSLNAQTRGLGRTSLGLIGSAAACANAAVLAPARADDAPRRAPEGTAGALAGWLTLAAFANLESTWIERDGRGSRATQGRRGLACAVGASAASAALAYANRGDRGFTLAALWGLSGVAVKNLRRSDRRVGAAALAGMALVAGAAILGRRARRPREA